MSYILTEEQQLIQQSAKDFAREYIEPIAAEMDHSSVHPGDIVKKMAEYDYFGLYLPTDFGGSEAGYKSFVLIVEELSHVSGAVASILVNHAAKAAYAINRWGSDKQKEIYLSALAKGEKLGTVAVNEPGAACGVGPAKLIAIKQDDGYLLNGQKTHIVNGGVADIYIVVASTNPDAGAKGLSAFIVDATVQGLSVGQVSGKMGLRGCQLADLLFDNVFVSAKNLLGCEGGGLSIVGETMAVASIAEGAQVVGIAQAAMEDAVKYSKERIQFKRPISSFPAIQNMLAEMATNIHLLRLGVYHAAHLLESGKNFANAAAMVKLFAARIGQNALIDVVQIEGGYGYSEEMVSSRLYRDIKGAILKDNSAEFPEKVIASELLV